MRRGATSRGRRKTRLRETHKIITYATLTRKAAANYSPLLFPLLLELEGGEFRLRRDFNAIPSDVCCLCLRLRLETGGVYVEQRFPRDLSECCAVLSPEKRRWFHGDRKFHPRMGWKWRSAMTEGIDLSRILKLYRRFQRQKAKDYRI